MRILIAFLPALFIWWLAVKCGGEHSFLGKLLSFLGLLVLAVGLHLGL